MTHLFDKFPKSLRHYLIKKYLLGLLFSLSIEYVSKFSEKHRYMRWYIVLFILHRSVMR